MIASKVLGDKGWSEINAKINAKNFKGSEKLAWKSWQDLDTLEQVLLASFFGSFEIRGIIWDFDQNLLASKFYFESVSI